MAVNKEKGRLKGIENKLPGSRENESSQWNDFKTIRRNSSGIAFGKPLATEGLSDFGLFTHKKADSHFRIWSYSFYSNTSQ